MAPRGPRRSHRPRVLHTSESSNEDELMTGPPTSSNGHGSRLPIRAQAAPMEENPVRAREAVTTDELSTRDQRPTPVRAREAVTTDELFTRGQRPAPVRAREAATTDELSSHAHRAPTETQPAYDPEAASSTMQDSDEDSDPEIREAQREFHELRRQRKLATVQRTRPPCGASRTTDRIGKTRVVEARIGFTRFPGRKALSIGHDIDHI